VKVLADEGDGEQGERAAGSTSGSPLMLNGDRTPVDENLGRVLADGDQVYLLAPLAGG
jgi:molybdopterin converting factor small subunit